MKVGLVNRGLSTGLVLGMGRYRQELALQQPRRELWAGGCWEITAGRRYTHLQAYWRSWRSSPFGTDVPQCTLGSACNWQPKPTWNTLHDASPWPENDGRTLTCFHGNNLPQHCCVIGQERLPSTAKLSAQARWPSRLRWMN